VTSRVAYLAATSADGPTLGVDAVAWSEAALRLWPGEDATEAPQDGSSPEAIDWDAMMLRHGRRVTIALLARGVRPERAKELAQEAWFRVIQAHRARRLVDLQLPGVVIAQASFLALDDRRRSQRRGTQDPGGLARSSPLGEAPDARDVERQMFARDELRRIIGVVERSHPNAQRVFHMLYGGRALSATEIASELGLSIQRVRQITCELRQRIRREIRGGEP
jgi:RNA polymerase sigma-70 factor (ECF subfamily)